MRCRRRGAITKRGDFCIAYGMKNNLTVHRTDERMYFLQRLLANRQFEADTHVFAPNVAVDLTSIRAVADGGIVVCGRLAEGVAEEAESRGIKIFNMMKDEGFQAVNSRLTAEGALLVMLERSLRSIEDSYVLVMGFGRMGAAVAKLLCKLNVRLAIATGSSQRPAYAFAKRVVPLSAFDFAPYDIIVNSVPYPIVSDAELMTMRQDALYIDLASKPAINLEYARYLGIDADIYPALPARTCPISAAVAMQEYILEVIK